MTTYFSNNFLSSGNNPDCITIQKNYRNAVFQLIGNSLMIQESYASNTQDRFEKLKNEWCECVRFSSSISECFKENSYLSLLDMGISVVPHLLLDLKDNQTHWFHALMTITNQDPVPSEEKGDIPKMTDRWIEWGQNNGFIEGLLEDNHDFAA